MIDCEPRVVLFASRSPTALEYRFPRLNKLLVQVPFSCPPAREISQAIVAAARQIPCARSNLLDDERSGSRVLHLRGAPEDSGARVSLIFQSDVNVPGYVLEQNGQMVSLDRVRVILKHKIPIAIRKGDFKVC